MGDGIPVREDLGRAGREKGLGGRFFGGGEGGGEVRKGDERTDGTMMF